VVEFSIIVTTYNRLALLKRALASSLAQTSACEIIIVDDASEDGTREYLKGLGGKVKFHSNQFNAGHSACVNAGVNLATGDWIKLLDDDDYLAPTCVETMVQAISTYPQGVICSCQAVQVNLEGLEIAQTKGFSSEKLTLIRQEDIHYRMLIEHLPFGTPAQVGFRKDAFLESGGWDSSFDLDYDDIDSWVRIAQFGDAILINQCLAYRTIWRGGYNQKFSLAERLAGNMIIKEKIYALVHEKYREYLPSMSDIRNYLKLYWGLVAIKNNQGLTGIKIAFPAMLSFSAWKLFLNALWIK
jgi:glycosyltransferase involved in cell wall biosynthesis